MVNKKLAPEGLGKSRGIQCLRDPPITLAGQLMSIASIPNSSAAQQWQAMQRSRASKPEAAPDAPGSAGTSAPASTNAFPVDLRSMSYDEMSVTLPGGLTLGIAHFGSSLDAGTEAQMVKSMEQLVGSLSGYTPPAGWADPTAASSTAAAFDPTDPGATADSGQGSLDVVHVGLPGGMSLDVRHHSPTAESGSEATTVQDRLVKEMNDLVAALKAYSGTSSTGTAASPPPTSSASAGKVA
jgi:hypothetical protein